MTPRSPAPATAAAEVPPLPRASRTALLPLCLLAALACRSAAPAADVLAPLERACDRAWVGPELWANPLEDWRVRQGRLECTGGGPGRSVHALTRDLRPGSGTLRASVRLGRLDPEASGAAGLAVGVRSELEDWRANLLRGRGVLAGITTAGRLFLDGPPAEDAPPVPYVDGLRLELVGEPQGEALRLTLRALDPGTGADLGPPLVRDVAAERLWGNLALVANPAFGAEEEAGAEARSGAAPAAAFWFDEWSVGGSKLALHPERSFGPILFAMHTLSRGVLKLTAQMPPLGAEDADVVRLELRDGGAWRAAGEARIDPQSCTATFRSAGWDASRDVPYRLVYEERGRDGARARHLFEGTVRREPAGPELLVAGLSCHQDTAFPNALVVRNLAFHDPDVLFFAGDQIYENAGGFGIVREPRERATLNYLGKWYLFGWAFRDLMRERVTVCIPDDHDVFQGNLWGAGGRRIAEFERGTWGAIGGYLMDPEWVRMVERTQTSHLPDPFDPTPVEQGIGVYYCDMVYGGVGFAVLEDRKFKSGPAAIWPKEGRADHVTDPGFDPRSADVPGAELLGQRQLAFLRHWAEDWRGQELKVALSQTIFCNIATNHGPSQQHLVADLDSNGWPQTGRNRALAELRRCFALHLAGDQHLPSLVHHGIDEFGDAVWSFCVPSVATGYARSWRPDDEGRPVQNRVAGPNTGEYLDGLGNKVTVWAVGNPERENRPGRLATLHDKASGYGLLRLDRAARTLAMECWRLQTDAAAPRPGDQFPGWPKTIHQLENYGRRPAAWLPTLRVEADFLPVLHVIEDASGELVYALRLPGPEFRPPVFAPGSYTLRIGEPGTERLLVLDGVVAGDDSAAPLVVRL